LITLPDINNIPDMSNAGHDQLLIVYNAK